MGRAYSLNGFINAALRRSNKTFLVEGPSDKHVLHKIELERYPTKAGAATIDHAGILDDPLIKGLGNKSKVLAIQAQADALALSIPKITAVLATLTDREWDGLIFGAHIPQPPWAPPIQKENRFITTGHSIENYHFNAECAKEFLKYAFPEHISAQVLKAIEEFFPAIMVFSAIFSLKIRDDSCLNRCSGLVDFSHIDIKNNRIYLHSDFEAACISRKIPSATTIVLDTNIAIDTAWADLVSQDFIHWLPHGHLGDETLWSAIAKVALQHGVSLELAQEIAHGYKKERERFKAQWLSKAVTTNRHPLDDAIDWLHA